MNREEAIRAARAIANHAEIAVFCLEEERESRELVRETFHRANKIQAELLRLRSATTDKRLHVVGDRPE